MSKLSFVTGVSAMLIGSLIPAIGSLSNVESHYLIEKLDELAPIVENEYVTENDSFKYRINLTNPPISVCHIPSETIFDTVTLRVLLIEDYENIHLNRYEKVTEEIIFEYGYTIYRPRIEYKTISYFKYENDLEPGNLYVADDLVWESVDVPAQYATREYFIKAENGYYTEGNIPDEFKTGSSYGTRTYIELYAISELKRNKSLSFSEIADKYNLGEMQCSFIIYRDKDFDVHSYLKSLKLNKFTVDIEKE